MSMTSMSVSFAPKLSMREEVFMYLRRLGFPVEVCDMIISKGALGGHLPIFSAEGMYEIHYARDSTIQRLDVGMCLLNHPTIITRTIPEHLRTFCKKNEEFLMDCVGDSLDFGREQSLLMSKMNMSYGDYFDEILEEKGWDWMLRDYNDRYTDSVSGQENKDALDDYFDCLSALDTLDEYAIHSTNDNVFRGAVNVDFFRRYGGNVDWGDQKLRIYRNPSMYENIRNIGELLDAEDEAKVLAVINRKSE